MLLNELIYTEPLLPTVSAAVHPWVCSEVAVAHGKMDLPCLFTPFSLAVSDDRTRCS